MPQHSIAEESKCGVIWYSTAQCVTAQHCTEGRVTMLEGWKKCNEQVMVVMLSKLVS
jgi:hypothetical protein